MNRLIAEWNLEKAINQFYPIMNPEEIHAQDSFDEMPESSKLYNDIYNRLLQLHLQSSTSEFNKNKDNFWNTYSRQKSKVVDKLTPQQISSIFDSVIWSRWSSWLELWFSNKQLDEIFNILDLIA